MRPVGRGERQYAGLRRRKGDVGRGLFPRCRWARVGNRRRAEEGGKAKKEAVLVMVRLDFSDHEKLSHQRWLDRIPTETLFRDAHPKIVRQNDQEFTSASERFEALD